MLLQRGFTSLELLSRTAPLVNFPSYDDIEQEFVVEGDNNAGRVKWNQVSPRVIPLINILRQRSNLPLLVSLKVRTDNALPTHIQDANTWTMAQAAQAAAVQSEYNAVIRSLTTEGEHVVSFCTTECVDVLDRAYVAAVKNRMNTHLLLSQGAEWSDAMEEYRAQVLAVMPKAWREQLTRINAAKYQDNSAEAQQREFERDALGYAPAKLRFVMDAMKVGLMVNAPLPCPSLYKDLFGALKEYEHGVRWVSCQRRAH